MTSRDFPLGRLAAPARSVPGPAEPPGHEEAAISTQDVILDAAEKIFGAAEHESGLVLQTGHRSRCRLLILPGERAFAGNGTHGSRDYNGKRVPDGNEQSRVVLAG